ncbi:neo-calmodulin-like isoform X1 [Acropora millepora]|uniref:neo-calmodulin-like isoform X1 n=1 Tax=Acropora millepora TaxID=45264 RepID=UPI001CF23218|nr:neo-calmodulin-like isoform X1 [Acropora millepora]
MTSPKFACFNGCPPSGGQFPYDSVHELSNVTSLSEYFDAFQHYDKNKSGFITAKDLGNLMKSLGENPTENELQRIINTVDVDGNGKMDFQEFVQLMSKKNQLEMNLKEVKEAFRIFDQDDRGYVLTSELRQAFERLEEEIPEDELEEILEDSYHGKSRKLFFEEFKKMTRVQNYHSVTSSSHNCIN